jgi:YVTN family beta-propeller protein/uncharacterized repeat protein (TIGR03803 family)
MIRRLATVLLLAIATSMLFAAENAKKTKTEFTTLADFTGSANGAFSLYGDLIEGTNGNFYGTAFDGGAYDEGTVFEVTPGGTLTTLYTFCSQTSCTDGEAPTSTLVQFEGNFYGTTQAGGINGAGIVNGAGTVFEVTPGGQLTTLYRFCSQPGCTDGLYPIAGLVQAGGNFYGTTELGGAANGGQGTVFKITPGGTLTTLYSFCSQSGCTDGYLPYAGLIQGTDGNFYGTTLLGGANLYGTVFKITPGGTLTTLYSFCSQSGCTDGFEPQAGLVQGTDGNFYGTTSFGGANGEGTVFRITPSGALTTLYSFCSQPGCADGEAPYAGLIQASDGNFYGTTLSGGANGHGTVFGITPGGQLSTLHSFAVTDGASPFGGLFEANGDLYGISNYGGTRFDGTVFSLPVGLEPLAKTRPSFGKAAANFMIRRPDLTGATSLRLGRKAAANFIHWPDLAGATGLGLSGNATRVPDLLGTKLRNRELAGAATGPMKVTALTGKAKSLAQTLTTLLNFEGANGSYPYRAFLIQGTDGNLYGTTSEGSVYDQGTVFKVTPGGTLTTLYTVCSQINCTDGSEPYAGLVQATNGNFYGTTNDGGANAGGGGTVFEITSGGQLTTLYSFCSQANCADGGFPYAGLIQATDGNLYGTTAYGGLTDLCSGCGTVFKITPSGTLTTLYSFCSQSGCTDGIEPEAGLIQGTDGNFYGTTSFGGVNNDAGTVFKITPSGTLTTLYSFCSQDGCTDGSDPQAGLVQSTDGNFYGTTEYGGSSLAQGTVFEVTPGGQLNTLYSFCSQPGCTDGADPIAGLVQAGGNFYGTTENGGANDGGTVFEVTPGGQFTTLYSFCSQPGCADGADPIGGLLQANGNLYGTTVNGGTRLDGTIFSLPLAQQSLTLSCPTFTAQLGVAYNSALTAAGGLAPYTFSILSGSLPPGLTLSTSTGAITGTPTTAGVYNFVAQVVDSQSNTVTTNCGIAVSPVPLTLSCPIGTGVVGVLYSSTVTVSGGVAPYTFSIISGSLPPGLTLNSSTGAITGTPTTAGTYNFTSKVVDSQGNKATASCSITINATLSCTNNGNLNGNYAFLDPGWSNFNGSGYVLIATAGSYVFDGNGNITSGQYDQNDPVDGPSQGTLTGTYCVPANNLGTMTLNGSNGHTTTFAFVLQPNGNGNIIPYDTTTPWDKSGIFLKQNTSDFSTSDFTGQYSLGFVGIDNASSRFGLAGAFTANGTANLTNGELDGDDGGNYFNGTFSSNNFSVTPSGRGTVTLNVSGVGTGNFAFYVVNSSQLLIVQIDPISQGLQTLFSGQIVQQQGLTYSDSDLNGMSVLGFQGLDTSCNPACADAELVFVNWNGSGSLSYTSDENDGGTVTSSDGSGAYSVGSNGRVPISGTGNHNPIFYLTGKNAGFFVISGGEDVQFGSMVAQSGSNFNNNSISGNYYGGSSELVSSNECGEVALVNVSSGNGNFTGESNCGESPRSETDSFTYTVSSDGRTVVTNGLVSHIFYIVSPSSGGSGGSFISLPWEGNTNPKLESYGVVPTTLALGCPTGTAQVGVAYSSALVASGGVAPYTFSITSGSLPPGLTLNTSTGAITGTPTTAGTYNFTAQVVDSQGNTATSSCSIVVSPALTLSCPTGTAQVGVAYSSALVASGGVAPYTFSITIGSLPPGLTLNTSTGAITGTPTTAGTYNFTAQVVDSKGNTATASCSIVVSSLTLSCPTGTAQVGVAYSSALTATGGVAPYTFSIISGSLPPGLTLNTSTGAITGTPTTSGTYNFTAQVVDSKGNTATASCSIVVSGLTLSCPTGTAQLGVAYSSALTASGGVAPYTFSIISGSLPPGLTLNTSTGAITGTPTTAGTYNFTAQVVDSKGNTASASCSIVVSLLTLTCPNGTGQVGVAYSSALVASGGVAPYTFSIAIGALPPGLSLNSSTGAITGTPTTAGTYNFTAQVVDSHGNTATSSCSIVVSLPALTLSCPTGTAQLGVAYSSVLNAAGGVAPYTFSITSGALPPGLSLNSSTGAITGTPTTQGTYNFTAQVVDSKGNTASASCSIMVTIPGTNPTTTSLVLSPSSIPAGSVGPIVMTATVTPVSGGGTPTGSVTYFNGPTQVGTATLNGGVGTFNYNPSSLAVGIYSITAVYSGDSMFSASTSSPQTLAITQNGPFAYVANNASDTVSVINIPTGQVADGILVGSGPWGTAISPDQTQVYVTNNQGNSVSVINAASGSVVATIPVQSSPFGVAFTPDGTGVYVVNGSSNTVSVINTATQTVVATVPVQNSPVSVAMAPTSNGTFAYVTNSASNTVSVIKVGSNPTVVQTIPVGTGPRWVTVSPNSALAYVENAGSNNVSVISVATNKVTATIPVGTSPFGAAFTPDNSTVYVANSGSNNVSVIDTQSGTVIDMVAGFNNPVQVALTLDGSSAYVTNLNANTVSVIATASNTITGTVQVGNAPTGVVIASAPQQTLQITQPLSPTQPNPFNFGSNTYTVQYPPGTQFSNVNMTITAVEITQAQFQQRVAGTQFANASCIVYGGGAGNCIDDQVTCSDNNGNPISCPSEPQATIAVQTSFTTGQAITNPGYLTTPIGQNMWQNIFTGFADPTVKGKTQGFSEFIAVDLGATGSQGAAHFELLKPKLPRNYEYGVLIPIEFKLTSVATGKPVNHAKAGLSVVMIADAKGNPTQKVIFEKTRAFKEIAPGKYEHDLAAGLAAGTYAVTIYGDSFPAFQGQFKILK